MKNFEDYFLNESLSDVELSDILLDMLRHYVKTKNVPQYKSGQSIRDIETCRTISTIEGILISIGVIKYGEDINYRRREYKLLWVFKGIIKEPHEIYIYRTTVKYLYDIGKLDDDDATVLLKNVDNIRDIV